MKSCKLYNYSLSENFLRTVRNFCLNWFIKALIAFKADSGLLDIDQAHDQLLASIKKRHLYFDQPDGDVEPLGKVFTYQLLSGTDLRNLARSFTTR